MKKIKRNFPEIVKIMVNTNVPNDEITLRIEAEEIICSKSLLMEHSDYFKVLLTGDFLEKNKKIIELKEISAETMKNLVGILQERELFFRCEDPYKVLSACEMFLFDELKTWIVTQLEQGLNTTNCLRVWNELESIGKYSLYTQAKSLSLLNFREILENNSMDTLSYDELCRYLGHINLVCDNETEVFNAAINWYRKHKELKINLKNILYCIDFKHSDIEDVIKMKELLGTNEAPDVLNILKYIIQLKKNEIESNNMNDECLKIAQQLMQSKQRYLPQLPCFLIKTDVKEECSEDNEVIYFDEYRRKRRQTVVGDENREKLVYYDQTTDSLHEFSHIPVNKCTNLTGFGMQGYKTKIIIFGGEFSMGKGSWNLTTWVFDTFQGKLEQKHNLPSARRHFESCICGHYLYVIGGTGLFRVIQNNMFFYDLQKERWSNEVVLPCSGRQIKCCNYNNELLVVSLSEKCVYIFNRNTNWTKISITDPDRAITSTLCTVFCYKGNLFLKGDELVELESSDNKFRVLKVTPLPTRQHIDYLESIITHDYCYTLYKQEVGMKTILLERLNLNSMEINYVEKKMMVEKLFVLHHHSLVVDDTFVNE